MLFSRIAALIERVSSFSQSMYLVAVSMVVQENVGRVESVDSPGEKSSSGPVVVVTVKPRVSVLSSVAPL